jgi:hypothetical protein
MKKRLLIGSSLLLIIFAVIVFFSQGYPKKIEPPAKALEKKKEKLSRVGEHIFYDVMLGGVRLGSSEFTHLPQEELDGKKVNVMVFKTKVTRFSDAEKIFSDPDTSLPLRVERDISNWPFSEKITERYDQKGFLLTITKFKGSQRHEQVIKKEDVIHNAILLPYFIRDVGSLEPNFSLKARLPTQEFLIKLAGTDEVVVPAGSFKAYRFISEPKKFEIWISADDRRIPVKIRGTSGVGYILVMREYKGY